MENLRSHRNWFFVVMVILTDTGTWSISGSTLTITDSEGEITIYEITSEGNNMTLTETGSWGNVVQEWVRQ